MQAVFTFTPPRALREQLEKEFESVEFSYYRGTEHIDWAQADIIVTYGEDLENRHIEEAVRARWIMVTSAGLEKMPFNAIKKQHIRVTNARGIHKIPMAEFTAGLFLQHAKLFKQLVRNEQQEIWNKKLPMKELHGSTVLIAGAGAIGSQIALLSGAFGMTALGVNTSGRPAEHFSRMYTLDEIEEALPLADYVVSVLPSTPETRYFYQDRHFRAMKESAAFINIGRGDAVEEKVLMRALENGEISHAYLDVLEEEPLPAGHPFWTMDNVTVTPHISSISTNYLPRALDIFKHNLRTFLQNGDDFLNVIDPDRGY